MIIRLFFLMFDLFHHSLFVIPSVCTQERSGSLYIHFKVQNICILEEIPPPSPPIRGGFPKKNSWSFKFCPNENEIYLSMSSLRYTKTTAHVFKYKSQLIHVLYILISWIHTEKHISYSIGKSNCIIRIF